MLSVFSWNDQATRRKLLSTWVVASQWFITTFRAESLLVSSDPLPWQCLARYPNSCHDTTFVDIDYEDLMMRKRKTVQQTQE